MNTSYYAKSANKFNAVSIAGRAPLWFSGRQYKKLAPKIGFFKKYKEDGDEAAYRVEYQRQVLDQLDPQQVYQELGEDAVLLCWETPEKFCHRHIVAEWLEKNLGIKITELE